MPASAINVKIAVVLHYTYRTANELYLGLMVKFLNSNSETPKLAVIILAAGQGKRLGAPTPKVTVSTREKPLISHVLDSVSKLCTEKVVIVTGFQKETVEGVVKDYLSHSSKNSGLCSSKVTFAFQEKQLGTGDAVKAAVPHLKDFEGEVFILYGDVPLVSSATLKKFLVHHQENNATLSLISFNENSPNQYGRVIRDKTGKSIEKIVEFKDCTPEQVNISEVNSGLYLVDSAFLVPAVENLKNENAQKEYYLTDILETASKEGQRISGMLLENSEEVLGVNTFYDLSLVNKALHMKKINDLINSGVQFDQPESVLLDSTVEIEPGARIGPNVQILGTSSIAKGAYIEGTAYILDSKIGENTRIKLGVRMEKAEVGAECAVGPFAHLRPGTKLERDVKIGNFVEAKAAHVKEGAKASHLTYLGDCSVGKNANIGAGTITCNYNGYSKHFTDIGADVFIGSNTCLVAPVKIEDGASIGAGSVITKTVEKDSLAVARSPQVNKPGWAKRRRESLEKAKK